MKQTSQSTNHDFELIKAWVPTHDRITIKSVGKNYRVNLYSKTGDIVPVFRIANSFFLSIVDGEIINLTR